MFAIVGQSIPVPLHTKNLIKGPLVSSPIGSYCSHPYELDTPPPHTHTLTTDPSTRSWRSSGRVPCGIFQSSVHHGSPRRTTRPILGPSKTHSRKVCVSVRHIPLTQMTKRVLPLSPALSAARELSSGPRGRSSTTCLSASRTSDSPR